MGHNMRPPNGVQIGITVVVLTLVIVAAVSAVNAVISPSGTNPLSGLGRKLSSLNLLESRSSDLILYSYFETDEAQRNLHYFLSHALHARADFIFLMNGNYTVKIPSRSNIRIIERENKCFDLGAYHEVLSANETLTNYKRFIMLNASVRGPFFPSWANHICWSDAFFDKLDSHVKAVGITYNCAQNYGGRVPPHLQSMLLATDQQAMKEILLPNLRCYGDYNDAVMGGEVQLTNWVRDAGYDVYAMMAAFAGRAGVGGNSTSYEHNCTGDEVYMGKAYDGVSLHPYDTM